jgi:hypothetical protein
MQLTRKLIEIQVRPGQFHDKLMEYYNSLPDEEKVLFKKTLRPVLPYLSTLVEVQDFLYWLNETDPIYITNQIRNNEFGYDTAKAMIWAAWNGVLNKS